MDKWRASDEHHPLPTHQQPPPSRCDPTLMPNPNPNPNRWGTSTRRQRLPPDWATRRAKVKQRAAGMCEAQVHVPTCDGIGNECDHINNNDNHALTNLQWLSAACHKAKTLQEAQTSRARRHGTRLRKVATPAAFKINQPKINTWGPPLPPPPYLKDRRA